MDKFKEKIEKMTVNDRKQLGEYILMQQKSDLVFTKV
jgi:hypothetical protein